MNLRLYKIYRTALPGLPIIRLGALGNSVTQRAEPHLKLH
jgi:hypothetical protein